MNNTNDKKVAVFVDVQNIYYTTRQAYGRQFNYRAVWKKIGDFGDIVMANAYAIERDNEGQRKFQRALIDIGFEIKLKPYILRKDGTSKGDWDVGITIDIMEAAQQVDTVVLLSGDGDFDLLLKKVRDSYQVKTHVFGVPELTAQSLIQATDYYHQIDNELLL